MSANGKKRSYLEYTRSGALSIAEAMSYDAEREAGRRHGNASILSTGRAAPDAFTFGLLDFIAKCLVEWYGPEQAQAVLKHYSEVCGRQPDKRKGDTA